MSLCVLRQSLDQKVELFMEAHDSWHRLVGQASLIQIRLVKLKLGYSLPDSMPMGTIKCQNLFVVEVELIGPFDPATMLGGKYSLTIRYLQTINGADMGKNLLYDSSLGKEFWGYKFMWSAWKLNFIPKKTTRTIMLYECFYGKKPKFNKVCFFGFAFVLMALEKTRKQDRVVEGQADFGQNSLKKVFDEECVIAEQEANFNINQSQGVPEVPLTPSSFKEAMKLPEAAYWKQAINNELEIQQCKGIATGYLHAEEILHKRRMYRYKELGSIYNLDGLEKRTQDFLKYYVLIRIETEDVAWIGGVCLQWDLMEWRKEHIWETFVSTRIGMEDLPGLGSFCFDQEWKRGCWNSVFRKVVEGNNYVRGKNVRGRKVEREAETPIVVRMGGLVSLEVANYNLFHWPIGILHWRHRLRGACPGLPVSSWSFKQQFRLYGIINSIYNRNNSSSGLVTTISSSRVVVLSTKIRVYK
ncbi:uncharacterized protein VP01_3027g3 [Puccinia sorghi]|uniref:Uncharacterized protein n=1 Tax=Puccinia sorghi TaxID=27349 RepID=A0A0L6V075_9BASI|nr:uncharacterized protein VP01_3027g3 [Puccinia sorghi]